MNADYTKLALPKELCTLCFPVAPWASLRTHVPVKNKLLLITKHTCSIPFQNSALHLTWSLPGLASASTVPGSRPNSYGHKPQPQVYYRMNAWPWQVSQALCLDFSNYRREAVMFLRIMRIKWLIYMEQDRHHYCLYLSWQFRICWRSSFPPVLMQSHGTLLIFKACNRALGTGQEYGRNHTYRYM